MPIRQISTTDDLRTWRQFRIGKLADLNMLDTRQCESGAEKLSERGSEALLSRTRSRGREASDTSAT
jgi:phosphodiesterase/alkaline phosphatase D-like protein